MKITVGRSFRIREFENYRVEFLEVEIAEGRDPIDATEELGKMCLEARNRYLVLEKDWNAEEGFVSASEIPIPPSPNVGLSESQIEAIGSLRDQLGDEGTRIVRTFELKFQCNFDGLTEKDGKDLIGELNAANRARKEEAEAKFS